MHGAAMHVAANDTMVYVSLTLSISFRNRASALSTFEVLVVCMPLATTVEAAASHDGRPTTATDLCMHTRLIIIGVCCYRSRFVNRRLELVFSSLCDV
jgi:hypothetical protein